MHCKVLGGHQYLFEYSKIVFVKKIYIIIEQKVLLDFELSEIYRYETKAFHQQLERNIEKFDKDFMFRLLDEEVSEL